MVLTIRICRRGGGDCLEFCWKCLFSLQNPTKEKFHPDFHEQTLNEYQSYHFLSFFLTVFVWLDTILTASDGRPTIVSPLVLFCYRFFCYIFSCSCGALALAHAGGSRVPAATRSLYHEDFTAASAVSLTPTKLVTQQENGISQSLLFQVFLLFLSFFLLCVYYIFSCISCCPTVLVYLVPFFNFQCLFCLLFGFGSFYQDTLKLRESFLGCVQSTNKHIRGTPFPLMFLIPWISSWFSLFFKIYIFYLRIVDL